MNSECLLETDPESLCLTLVQAVSILVANAGNCDPAFFLIEHLGLFWPGGKEEYSSNTKGGSDDTPAVKWKAELMGTSAKRSGKLLTRRRKFFAMILFSRGRRPLGTP